MIDPVHGAAAYMNRALCRFLPSLVRGTLLRRLTCTGGAHGPEPSHASQCSVPDGVWSFYHGTTLHGSQWSRADGTIESRSVALGSPDRVRVWTDDYTSIVPLLRWW